MEQWRTERDRETEKEEEKERESDMKPWALFRKQERWGGRVACVPTWSYISPFSKLGPSGGR